MNSEQDIYVIGQENTDTKIPSYKQTIVINVHHYYITGTIGAPEKYLELIHTLKTMEETETIFIYLNTYGGDLDTTVQLIAAMSQCAGTVITSLEGQACSAGTLIFLCGQKYIVNPFSTFMIHNYSSDCGGKGLEAATRMAYNQRYFTKLCNEIYKGFLTDDEIKHVLDDKDIWMDSDEVLERLERMEKETEESAPDAVEHTVEEAVQATVKKAPRKKSPSRKT